jgi:hypothetical protein
MGKHSSGGWFGSGGSGRDRARVRQSGGQRSRIPAERVLEAENPAPLRDAQRRPGIESAPARLRM